MLMSERYFFHLVSRYEVIPDHEGVYLLTDEELLPQILQVVNKVTTETLSSDGAGVAA
jgi:hypothetical protein